MQGWAYAFLRKNGAPLPPGCAGHIGFAFTFDQTVSYGGSVENPDGSPLIAAGGDTGFWLMKCLSQDLLVAQFKRRNYNSYKVAKVDTIWPDNAFHKAQECSRSGYIAISNNCLDQTYAVLAAYGVVDLPWKQTHPSPNDWFANFNGKYVDI